MTTHQLTLFRRPVWLLAYPFRLFFVLGSAWAALSALVWVAIFSGLLSAQPGLAVPMHWHAHEMIHGMTSAMIAGFLLTAMSNWTGIPAPSGRLLGALGLLWVLGRLSVWLADALPSALVWSLSPAFYLALAVLALRDLIRSGNRRNLPMPLILLLLGVGSALMLYGADSLRFDWQQAGTLFSLYLIILLMTVIAGRITPAFTANWLRMKGLRHDDLRRLPLLDWGGVVLLVLVAIADITGMQDSLLAALALGAAAVHSLRLWYWRGWRTLDEPLLWVLHLGYLCIALSLGLRGLTALADIPLSLWYHTVGIGAMGILIVGVMTRVGLGHTGRPLTLPILGLAVYFAMILALASRLITLLVPGVEYLSGLWISAGLWALSFGLFLWVYVPILTAPRPDGKVG